MKLVKIETINYDPDTKTLTFRGVNRFSRKRRATLFIEDEPSLLEALHQAFADPNGSSLEFSEFVKLPRKAIKKRNSQKSEATAEANTD